MDWRTTICVSVACVASAAGAAQVVSELSQFIKLVTVRSVGSVHRRLSEMGVADALLDSILYGIQIALVLGAACLVLWGAPLIAIGFAVIVCLLPSQLLSELAERREDQFRQQLVVASRAVANLVRAGQSLANGLDGVRSRVTGTLQRELDRISYEYQHGRPLREALQHSRERISLEEMQFFTRSLETALERGGPLNEMMDRLAESLQEMQRLKQKLRSETSKPRRAIQLMALFPPLFVLLMFLFDPHSVDLLFHSFWGQIVVVIAGILTYGGIRWTSELLKLPT